MTLGPELFSSKDPNDLRVFLSYSLSKAYWVPWEQVQLLKLVDHPHIAPRTFEADVTMLALFEFPLQTNKPELR